MITLRVGIFCPTLNVYGGGEFVATVVANTLTENGYEVIFFANKEVNRQEMERFFGESLNPSIKIIVKPSKVQSKGLLDFYQTIFHSYTFKSKCDIWIDVYSCCIFPWTNISYIHFPFLNHYYYKPKFPYIKSRHLLPISGLPYVFFMKNFMSNNKKLILANSRYTACEIKKFSGKKSEVLYPPVPSIFFNTSSKNTTKNQRKNLVVTISRFAPGKGLEKIPYIASLTEKNIQFAIIGRVHYKNILFSLQKLTRELGLKDRINFFLNTSIVEMKEMLKNAKIYLHTKIGEHFGISIVQAMAMGCIPIVHNSGGVKEFVPNNFRYNNIREAAKKITNEIHAWSLPKTSKIIEIAKNFRQENFSKEFLKCFKKYEEEFSKLKK
jgi:glycosyltransferase involved in cell wall biosynthesis